MTRGGTALVISMGSCANAAATPLLVLGGSRLRPDRTGGHLRAWLSPTAEALIYGILQLQKKIRRTNTIAR